MYTSNKVKRLIIALLLGLFGIFPLFWITLVSIQPSGGKYQFIPTVSWEAYTQVFTLNNGEIFHSIIYSFVVSSIATLVAVFFALCSVYIVLTENTSIRIKKRIIAASIGLYFLPVFIAYTGLQAFNQVYEGFNQPSIQLILMESIFGYVIAFILLFAMYLTNKTTYFEQLLLETGSRIRAFYFGIVSPKLTGTLVVAGITFTTVWSEFFLSNLITTSETLKPFSVVLQRFNGQYTTNYSVFAAGAVLSLVACLIFFLILFIIGRILHLKSKKGDNLL